MIKFLKDFFGFSKKELNGLLVFGILITAIAFAPLIYSWLNPPEKYNYSEFAKEVASFRATAQKKVEYQSNRFLDEEASVEEKKAPQLFSFNPNGLSVLLWKKLGLSERQIKVIKNFEAKGGKFYRKEDLKKIYSIKEDEYALLEPYIAIPERAYASNTKAPYEKRAPLNKTAKVIELNNADSTELESINGIGPAFASRIIKYRTRLGGFYSKEQIKEVYGLDSSMYQKLQSQITVNPALIQQVMINTVEFAELKRCPYLTYKQVNAILNYRKQHGLYKSIDDLKRVVILNEDVLNKIRPYLSFN